MKHSYSLKTRSVSHRSSWQQFGAQWLIERSKKKNTVSVSTARCEPHPSNRAQFKAWRKSQGTQHVATITSLQAQNFMDNISMRTNTASATKVSITVSTIQLVLLLKARPQTLFLRLLYKTPNIFEFEIIISPSCMAACVFIFKIR